MAGLGHLKMIWKDACRVAGTILKACSSEMLGGQGDHFLRWVAFWSIRSSDLLKWLYVTEALHNFAMKTWHHFFVASTILRQIEWKNASRIGTGPSVLNSHFYFLIEVSQTCLSFGVVNLLCFWCRQPRQPRKLRTSRTVVSFLTWSSSKMKEALQNSFLFKLANRLT